MELIEPTLRSIIHELLSLNKKNTIKYFFYLVRLTLEL